MPIVGQTVRTFAQDLFNIIIEIPVWPFAFQKLRNFFISPNPTNIGQ